MHSTSIYPSILSVLATTIAAAVVRDTPSDIAKRDIFQWGVIGDSYASGVAYLQANTYDNNTDMCLRTTEAYGPQLEGDNTWQNGATQQFNFAACSGSHLGDMAQGQHQTDRTGASPSLVIMTAGGNNAGFFSIVDSCIYHINGGIDYGPDYANDTARTGACAKAIDFQTGYINGGLGSDLSKTIVDIFDRDNVKSNPDFLLYVTGYATFFGLDDDWCNTHSFGIRSRPPLSHVLRNDINNLVKLLNNAYSNVIQKNFAKNVRFVDIDQGFSGHRFCEAGSSIWRQYFDGNVWFWNVSPPWLVTPESHDDQPTEAAVQAALQNLTVAPYSSGTGNVADGWRMRPFHPKVSGHIAIKDSIIAQMKSDKLPSSSSSGSTATTSAPPPPANPPPPTNLTPAYATGTCSIHVNEYQACESDDKNLYAVIVMHDNNNVMIGQTIVDPTQDPIGEPINAADPYSFASNLSNPMVVVGEHQNDYIQFSIGDLHFTSRTTQGPATCRNGGWDPRQGPNCSPRFGSQVAKNQIDCSFPC